MKNARGERDPTSVPTDGRSQAMLSQPRRILYRHSRNHSGALIRSLQLNNLPHIANAVIPRRALACLLQLLQPATPADRLHPKIIHLETHGIVNLASACADSAPNVNALNSAGSSTKQLRSGPHVDRFQRLPLRSCVLQMRDRRTGLRRRRSPSCTLGLCRIASTTL